MSDINYVEDCDCLNCEAQRQCDAARQQERDRLLPSGGEEVQHARHDNYRSLHQRRDRQPTQCC